MQIQGKIYHLFYIPQIPGYNYQDRGVGQHRGREVQPRQCLGRKAPQLSGRELSERMLQGRNHNMYRSMLS